MRRRIDIVNPTVLVSKPGIVLLLVVTMGLGTSAQTSDSTVLRDRDNSVSCVVTRPTLPALATRDADYLAIDLRLPGTPPAGALARLPAQSRDFSTLPIHVFLVPSPSRATTSAARLRRTDPLIVQPTFLRPIVNG